MLIEETNRRGLGGKLLHQTTGKLTNRNLGNRNDLTKKWVVDTERVILLEVVEAPRECVGPLFEFTAMIVDPVWVDVGLIAPSTPLALRRML